MAYTSSLFYTRLLPNPRGTNVPLHDLSKEEVVNNIRLYHLLQLHYIINKYSSSSERLGNLKGLIDRGVPPVICYDQHAVTGIGYIDIGDASYIVVYDNENEYKDQYKICKIDYEQGIMEQYATWNDVFSIEPEYVISQDYITNTIITWIKNTS